MIDNRSPTNAFISVLFPTLGFPIIFTKPALCSAIFYFFAKVNFLNSKNQNMGDERYEEEVRS
jgi:hypothetical protein